MKVSKKRLIEIVTEEISRMRKEAYYRKYTPGGSEHRDIDPRHSPRRRRARESEQGPSPEELAAVIAGVEDGVAAYNAGTSEQPNRPADDRMASSYVHGWFVGWVPDEKLADQRRQRLMSYEAELGQEIDTILAGRDSPMQEGTWDDRRTRRKSRSQQMTDAEVHAEEDAEFIQSWEDDYDDRDLPHNHHGRYGWGPDEPGIGEAGKFYWKRRNEVLQHFKKSGDPVWYSNE